MFKKPTAAELAREGKREIAQAARGLDKEIASLHTEEKKLILEIKKAAKSGNEAGARVLAKNLVRVRGQITKIQNSQAHLRGIQTHVQTAHSTAVMAGAVGKAGGVMKQANAQLDPVKAAAIAMDFQKESAKMDHADEVLGDAMSGVLDSDEIDEESDLLTQEVLDSIGVDTRAQLASAPRAKIAGSEGLPAISSADTEDLDKRFAALKG